MKKGLIGLLSLLLIGVLAGCGSPAPAPEGNAAPERNRGEEAADEGSATAAPVVEEAVVEAAPAEEAPAEPVAAEPTEEMTEEAPAEAVAAMDGLVGTKWVYDGIALEFKEGNKVFLKGGPLAALAPDGTDAAYTLEEGGAFEVTVLGQSYSGTFDGTKLMVDGKEAVKEQ